MGIRPGTAASDIKELRPGIPEECSGSRPVSYFNLELEVSGG